MAFVSFDDLIMEFSLLFIYIENGRWTFEHENDPLAFKSRMWP